MIAVDRHLSGCGRAATPAVVISPAGAVHDGQSDLGLGRSLTRCSLLIPT